MEFWESSFRDKQEMWGFEPAGSAITALELFKKHKLKKILIPGFGYGRNAGIFITNGFDVTGIEISETAINLAKKHYGENVNVYHGPVSSMPFDKELYNGIFCYALIHLLNAEERAKLIGNCYSQLSPGGYMFFVAISKNDTRYGEGEEISKNTFKTKHGIRLFFYDRNAIETEFGSYGLIEANEINEAVRQGKKPQQRFWQIICNKAE